MENRVLAKWEEAGVPGSGEEARLVHRVVFVEGNILHAHSVYLNIKGLGILIFMFWHFFNTLKQLRRSSGTLPACLRP